MLEMEQGSLCDTPFYISCCIEDPALMVMTGSLQSEERWNLFSITLIRTGQTSPFGPQKCQDYYFFAPLAICEPQKCFFKFFLLMCFALKHTVLLLDCPTELGAKHSNGSFIGWLLNYRMSSPGIRGASTCVVSMEVNIFIFSTPLGGCKVCAWRGCFSPSYV